MKLKKIIVISVLLVISLIGLKIVKYLKYHEFWITKDKFKGSVEYDLAKAVQWQNEKKIKSFCIKHPECIQRTYEEHYYSVLHWAAETGKMKSVKALLDAGMNPDVLSDEDETPLHTLPYNLTASPFTKSKINYGDIILLLIKYGADCNYPINLGVEHVFYLNGITPFVRHVIKGHLDYADIMLKNADVDVNAKMQDDVTAAVYTLREASEYKSSIYNAHYIICKCKADITNPFVMKKKLENFEVKWVKTYPVQLLRELLYPLDSEEYKLKLEIIEEFKNQGIDYYSEPIPDDVLDKIKSLYPKTWEEYIKVY